MVTLAEAYQQAYKLGYRGAGPSQYQPQASIVDLDAIMEAGASVKTQQDYTEYQSLVSAYGLATKPSSEAPLVDLDIIMQAGAQVKTKEDLPYFKSVVQRYGKPIQPTGTEMEQAWYRAKSQGLDVGDIGLTTMAVDLDYILEAGLQVKKGTPEEKAWFNEIIGKYGKPAQAFEIRLKQPSWKEGSISGQIYTGEYKGAFWEFLEHTLGLNISFVDDPLKIALRKSVELAPLREIEAGFIGIGESWINPEVPTPTGALIGKVFGSTSAYETGEVSPFYLIGGLFGTYVEFKALAASYKALTLSVSKIPYGGRIVSHALGRAGISALFGGGLSYITSKGDIKSTAIGAALGGGLSLGIEYIGIPLVSEIRAKLPKWFPGHVERMKLGESTFGKTGEKVDTYVSQTLDELDDRAFRIVGDVTENPIGVFGENIDDLLEEYLGKRVPTGHATLTPGEFDLAKGGETLLKGFASEGRGFRSAQEWYHFYSAPGSERFVTVYGGYMGIGEGYSGVSPKLVFGGKPTALITTNTFISGSFLQQKGESIRQWFNRVSNLSGLTGIAPETLMGASMERQFITPAAYKRFGEQLSGSIFKSAGKIGTFQVKIIPKGWLGKIPIIRTLASQYTHIKVFGGSYAAVKGAVSSSMKTLSVPAYTAASMKNISIPRSVVSASALSSTLAKSFARSTSLFSSRKAFSLSRISYPKLSVPSLISKPSKPSRPSYPIFSLPSHPSKPSYPSKISYPSKGFRFPSTPSLTSQIKRGKPLLPRKNLFGTWFKRTHPIKTERQMLETFGFGPTRKRKGKIRMPNL